MKRFSVLWVFSVFFVFSAHASSKVYVAQVNGVINTGTVRYIQRSIDLATAQNSSLLVVVMSTPGGLLSSTREIVQSIGQSSVPVAVYVSPSGASATSAGTIITMSAHVAAMAPGTNIGAAHPVAGQGQDIKGDMAEKAVNDTVAFIKSQAQLRGRNAEWAEQSIRKSVSVPADEAVKLRVIDFLAIDLEKMLTETEGRVVALPSGKKQIVGVVGSAVEKITMTAGERLLSFLGDPNVSYLLMVAGGLGLYAELTSPGLIFPGVLGSICLILAFISFSTLPINSGAVALLVLGLVLFVLEVFVTSYGVLTIGGIVSLVLGALFLMDPSTGDLRLSLALVLPTVLAIGLIAFFVGTSLLRARRGVYRGLSHMEGFEGVVQSIDAAGRQGKCLMRGEIWDFELFDPDHSVHVGDRISVIENKGFKLRVRKA
ncbi:MAG: nodulation protein NfeD [Bdellovibrionota bacterium]